MNEERAAEASRTLSVGPEEGGERLDRWLARSLPQYSRSRLQAMIRDGRVEVDGKPVRASQLVAPGQRVVVRIPAPPLPTLQPLPLPLRILYEDDDLLVVVKPRGLVVHPGAGAPVPTLVQALLHRDPSWVPPGPSHRPGIVHRLDRDTTGLLLVARSEAAYRALAAQISRREVTRRYVALVWGSPQMDSGVIDAPIGRDPRDRRRMAVTTGGRPASTTYSVVRRFDTLALLDLVLGTGRTHQIRVHLAHLGHPVFGDRVYAGTRGWLMRQEAGSRMRLTECLRIMSGQALHAYHLSFRHPADGRRMRFEAPVPEDMDEVLRSLVRESAVREDAARNDAGQDGTVREAP